MTHRDVHFDILRGYNNFRLLLISSKNRGAFVNVKTRDDFHVFKAGNGANWTDTRILRVDGIKVITAVNFDSLLKMLVAGRFDYISRGSHEIHYDVQTYGSLGFPVSTIPRYFYLRTSLLFSVLFSPHKSDYVKQENQTKAPWQQIGRSRDQRSDSFRQIISKFCQCNSDG
jgi:hypothetical protein